MAQTTQDGFTDIALSPLSSCAWDDWTSWHTISTSQPYLNDTTELEQAEDLKALSNSLSFRTARAEEKRNTPLDDETWGDWLDKSIATTAVLIAKGKQNLASEASDIVSKVLAYENDLHSWRAVETKGRKLVRTGVDLVNTISKRVGAS